SIFAPVLFISFHLLRPLFFLPVVVICISGGMIFGTVAGTIYSIIGIMLSSIFFYGIIHWIQKAFHKFTNLREKVFVKQLILTPLQIALLLLVPFIHFHLF